jgi:hypothetical protein
VADAKDHPAHHRESKKKADRGQKESAARPVRDVIVHERANASAMKKQKQQRNHHQQNQEENCGIVELQVHGTLNRDPDVDGNPETRQLKNARSKTPA